MNSKYKQDVFIVIDSFNDYIDDSIKSLRSINKNLAKKNLDEYLIMESLSYYIWSNLYKSSSTITPQDRYGFLKYRIVNYIESNIEAYSKGKYNADNIFIPDNEDVVYGMLELLSFKFNDNIENLYFKRSGTERQLVEYIKIIVYNILFGISSEYERTISLKQLEFLSIYCHYADDANELMQCDKENNTIKVNFK